MRDECEERGASAIVTLAAAAALHSRSARANSLITATTYSTSQNNLTVTATVPTTCDTEFGRHTTRARIC